MIIDRSEKKFDYVNLMLIPSVLFTLMSYQNMTSPSSEPWVGYLFYFGAVVAYLGLGHAIYMKIRDKRNGKTMY